MPTRERLRIVMLNTELVWGANVRKLNLSQQTTSSCRTNSRNSGLHLEFIQFSLLEVVRLISQCYDVTLASITINLNAHLCIRPSTTNVTCPNPHKPDSFYTKFKYPIAAQRIHKVNTGLVPLLYTELTGFVCFSGFHLFKQLPLDEAVSLILV